MQVILTAALVLGEFPSRLELLGGLVVVASGPLWGQRWPCGLFTVAP